MKNILIKSVKNFPIALCGLTFGLILFSCGPQMSGYTETDGVYYDPNKDVIPASQIPVVNSMVYEEVEEEENSGSTDIIAQSNQNIQEQNNRYKDWGNQTNVQWGTYAGTDTYVYNNYNNWGWGNPYMGWGMGYGAWNNWYPYSSYYGMNWGMSFGWGNPYYGGYYGGWGNPYMGWGNPYYAYGYGGWGHPYMGWGNPYYGYGGFNNGYMGNHFGAIGPRYRTSQADIINRHSSSNSGRLAHSGFRTSNGQNQSNEASAIRRIRKMNTTVQAENGGIRNQNSTDYPPTRIRRNNSGGTQTPNTIPTEVSSVRNIRVRNVTPTYEAPVSQPRSSESNSNWGSNNGGTRSSGFGTGNSGGNSGGSIRGGGGGFRR